MTDETAPPKEKKWGPIVAGTFILLLSLLGVAALTLGPADSELWYPVLSSVTVAGFVAAFALFTRRPWCYRAAAIFYVLFGFMIVPKVLSVQMMVSAVLIGLLIAYFVRADRNLQKGIKSVAPRPRT